MNSLLRIAALIAAVATLGGWPSVNLGVSAQAGAAPVPPPIASYNMGTSPPMLDGVGSADGTCTTCPAFNATGGPNGGPFYAFSASSEELITIPGATIDLHSNNSLSIVYDFRGTVALVEDVLTRAGQFAIGGTLSSETLFSIAGGSTNTAGEEAGGDWHNVALVYDGTADTATAYVDGILSKIRSDATTDLTSNTSDIELSSSTSLFSLSGDLANLQFFDVALTGSQVAAIAGVDL